MTPHPLILLDLAVIAALPVAFFRRGRLNARWWFTAAPFLIVAVALLADLASPWRRLALPAILQPASIGVAGLALALMAATLAAHARPISLWHQDDDEPREIVVRGPYARIRHPFYASFLLVLLAALLALPHVITLATLAWGGIALTLTAMREERRLLASPLSDEYRRLVVRTGRFCPRLRGPS
jgi:protein-S-isoprenylcysteine O-methyltransferase Ste14